MIKTSKARNAVIASMAAVLVAGLIALPACSGAQSSSSGASSKTVTLQPVLIKSSAGGSSGQGGTGDPSGQGGQNAAAEPGAGGPGGQGGSADPSSGGQGGTPPAMPEGENGNAPSKPDGGSGSQPPAKPDGEAAGGNGGNPDNPGNGGNPGTGNGGSPDGQGMANGTGDSSANDSSAKAANVLGSWSMGGTDAASISGDDYAYDAALYITKDGIDKAKSTLSRITGGTYDDKEAKDITISDTKSGDNGILVVGTKYAIKNVVIDLLTNANGNDTCDFSGKGSAIAVFGKDANVTVDNTKVHTSGVATMPLFVDDGATVTLHECTLQSDGGTLHASYMNTPDQTLMVAPPWILGIMGTSRAANMMGTNSTSNFIDCETSAGAWAVLSVDAGSNMAQNIFNTTLTLNNADESAFAFQEAGGQITQTLNNPYTVNYGSGYGTYAIGNAAEVFAGATLNVGTYATIFTGGSALYTALENGTTYNIVNWNGDSTATYTAKEDKATVINSDTFGFMAHQQANDITIEKGTIVNSGYATFLVKSGSSNETLTARVDNAKINNGGVLIQVMDNDDATNGGMMDADDPANTNGGNKIFKSTHTEISGFFNGETAADSSVQQFTFTNGEYNGNIYNASGSDGLKATRLEVTLGAGAVLDGAAASTSAVHVTYDGSVTLKADGGMAFDSTATAAEFAAQYQNTSFDITHYFDIGHVANMVYSNGGNAVNMTLTDNAVWKVKGTSLINSLNIKDNAKVVVPEGVTLTVNGKAYTNCTLTAADTQG